MISAVPPDAAATLVGRLTTGKQSAKRIADRLIEHFAAEDIAVSLADAGNGRWRVAIYLRAPADEKSVRALLAASAGPDAAKALRFAGVAARDWVRDSLTGLAPVPAGRFIVHGAHDRARIPPNRIAIEIEAALAFGTGHHGTTRGCLLALDGLWKRLNRRRPVRRHLQIAAKRPWKDAAQAAARRGFSRSSRGPDFRATVSRPRYILDLGTGSAVLAIAAARALRRPVLATDIDPDAVRVARANARLNGVAGMVEVVKADGVKTPILHLAAPFDLIFANMLLEPLRRLAPTLRLLTAPGGRMVLSGLLPPQANAGIAAYRPLVLEGRIDLDGWTTLIFARRRQRRP